MSWFPGRKAAGAKRPKVKRVRLRCSRCGRLHIGVGTTRAAARDDAVLKRRNCKRPVH